MARENVEGATPNYFQVPCPFSSPATFSSPVTAKETVNFPPAANSAHNFELGTASGGTEGTLVGRWS